MRTTILISISGLAIVLGAGCTAPPPSTPASAIENDGAGTSTRPSGGELIELGDKEFYVELKVNEQIHDISFVILDKAAKNPVPIDATMILVRLKHQGKPELHKIIASPLISDGDGKSSRFVLKGAKHLHADLEQVEADAHLEVTINGKTFSGRIAQHRNSRPRTK